ncbi:unnamed protein product, partial [Phaeothamnion confervicola]
MPPRYPPVNEGIEWRSVPGSSNIMVSDQGLVWSIHYGRLLKQKLISKYYKVAISVDGQSDQLRKVHTLVAEAFVPRSCPHIFTVPDHKNRNMRDNRASNLRWSTAHLNAYNETNNRHG